MANLLISRDKLEASGWRTNLDSGSDHIHGVGDGGGGGGSQGSGHGLQEEVRAVARRQFGELLWNISRTDAK